MAVESCCGWVGSRAGLWLAWAVAGWPVWRWFAARIHDGSDEPWGLVALALAAVGFPWRRFREPAPAWAVWSAVAVTAMVALCRWPPMIRGGLWMLVLTLLLAGTGPVMARIGLLLLALPVTATAQFFLGYPLRVFAAAASEPLLGLLGFNVERQGVALHWAGETVLVDAPCSGIQMLWAGGLCGCVLAQVWRMSDRATAQLLGWTGAAVVLANTLRCAALFWMETRWRAPAGWLHESVGVIFFGMMLGGVSVFAGKCAHRATAKTADPRQEIGDEPSGSTVVLPAQSVRSLERQGRGRRDRVEGEVRERLATPIGAAAEPLDNASTGPGIFGSRRAQGERMRSWALFGALAVAAIRSWGGPDHEFRGGTPPFPGWPAEFDGRQLELRPPTDREARFAADFPGRIAVASDGERLLVLRWVAVETRRLHPAMHCLRGLGYAVQPGGIWRDARARFWGVVEAEKGGRRWRVRERIEDGTGRAWTDVSSWWWEAWLGRTSGPWWVTTVFEPLAAARISSPPDGASASAYGHARSRASKAVREVGSLS